MACPVLISPACIVAGKVVGAVAGTAASGALNGIAAAIESGITWMVTQTSTWWVQLPSPDLSGEPAVGQLQQWMLPLTVAVAVLGLIIAGGKMTLTRRANPLIDAGSGLAVISATSAVGILLPALLIIFIRRGVPEPPRAQKPNEAPRPLLQTLGGIFQRDVLRATLVGGLFGTGAHGGYSALTTFLPTYLREVRQLSVLGSSTYLAVIIVAFFCGCIVSGILSDRIGRRANVALFASACVATVLIYIFAPLSNGQMLFLGFPLGFFSAGIPASMAALFSELYPAGVRGTGVGFCYNFGRILSAAFPLLVGFMSDRIGLGPAIGIDAALAYSLVLIAVLMLPETRGKVFETAAVPAAN